MLCCHVLKVLTSQRVTEIPAKYILKRWTKNAKKGVARAVAESLTDEIDPKRVAGRRYRASAESLTDEELDNQLVRFI